MTGRDFAADVLAAIQRRPKQVVLTARAADGQTVTVVVGDMARYEAQRLIRHIGWEHVDTTVALSLGNLQKIGRAAR